MFQDFWKSTPKQFSIIQRRPISQVEQVSLEIESDSRNECTAIGDPVRQRLSTANAETVSIVAIDDDSDADLTKNEHVNSVFLFSDKYRLPIAAGAGICIALYAWTLVPDLFLSNRGAITPAELAVNEVRTNSTESSKVNFAAFQAENGPAVPRTSTGADPEVKSTFGLKKRSKIAKGMTGILEAKESAQLAASESGIISEISVAEGERVQPGAVVATLDLSRLEAEQKVVESRAKSFGHVEATQAELKMREFRFQKLQALHNSGTASREELERSRAEYEIATANFKAAQEEQELAQLDVARIRAQIEGRIIKSPIEGIIVEINHKIGEFVSPAQPEIGRVVNPKVLRVTFYAPVASANQYRVGKEVSVRVDGMNEKIPGTVTFVSPVIDAETNTIRIFVDVQNLDERLPIGAPCELEGSSESENGQKT